MKLYTEEQVRQAYIDGMSFIAVDPTKYEQDAEEYVRDVHSIELPSDVEIEEEAQKQWGNVHRTGVLGFIDCAKWMRDKLTNTDKK